MLIVTLGNPVSSTGSLKDKQNEDAILTFFHIRWHTTMKWEPGKLKECKEMQPAN
jgi:hypothetical protein